MYNLLVTLFIIDEIENESWRQDAGDVEEPESVKRRTTHAGEQESTVAVKLK